MQLWIVGMFWSSVLMGMSYYKDSLFGTEKPALSLASCNFYSFSLSSPFTLSDKVSAYWERRETGSLWNILQQPKALSNRESVGCCDSGMCAESSDLKKAIRERRAFTLFLFFVNCEEVLQCKVTKHWNYHLCENRILDVTVPQPHVVTVTQGYWIYSEIFFHTSCFSETLLLYGM